jgi:hypothetical protein
MDHLPCNQVGVVSRKKHLTSIATNVAGFGKVRGRDVDVIAIDPKMPHRGIDLSQLVSARS